MKKRILAFLLCFALVMPILPVSATETDPTETTAASSEPTVTSAPTDPSEPAPSTEPSEPTTPPVTPASGEEEEATDPTEKETEPSNPTTEPSTEATDPSEPETEPSSEPTDPSEPETEPSTEATDPSEPETEPTDPIILCAACGAAEGHADTCLLGKTAMIGTGITVYQELGNEESAKTIDFDAVVTVDAAESDAEGTIWYTVSYYYIEDGIYMAGYNYVKASDTVAYTVNEVYYSYTKAGPFLPAVYVENPNQMMFASYGLRTMALDDGIALAAEEDSDLETSKTAIDNGDGTYTITIEAYATGKITTETVTTSSPCDIVLVLDMSSSMTAGFDDTSRFLAVKTAVTNFATQVYEKSKGPDGQIGTADDVAHRISIITYATNSTIQCGLKDVTINYSTVTNAINSLATNTGTRTDSGLESAITVFNNYSGNDSVASGDRQRVVVLFTDGYPSTSGSTNFTNRYANSAIANAYTLKNTWGATVYSVAVLDGADPTADFSGLGTNVKKVNCMLHAISSNYPNATATAGSSNFNPTMGEGGNNGYYLVADNTTKLNNIFTDISQNIQSGSSSTTLGSSAVVKDIVSPYFVLPDNTTDITVQTVDCTGYSGTEPQWSTTKTTLSNAVSIDKDTKSVNVTGFDFSANFVASTGRTEGNVNQSGDFYGRKLVIRFDVTPNPDFLGGDDVITNGAASGIYDGEGKEVVILEQPEVDVALKTVGVAAVDQNIYLGTAVDLPTLAGLGDYTVNGVEYTVDGTNNAYVDIVYTITDYEGNPVGTYKIEEGATTGTWTLADGASATPVLYEDKTYNVTCKVTSVNDTTKTTKATDSGAANVFVPVITFNDTAINLGESANYANNGGTIEKWVHGTTESSAVTMNSDVPTLTYGYSPEADAFTEETNVKVTVTINGTDVSEYVKFYRDACTVFDSCTHKTKAEVASADDRVNFVVHIKTFNLTIEKTGANTTLDPSQTFIFYVTGPNGFTQTVVIEGNGSKTLVNLPVGTYTVVEDTGWSWRYTPDEESKSVTPTGATATVTFKNTRNEEQWLDGNSYAKNSFSKLSAN